MARIWIPSLAALLCICGVSVAADALVTTDQERLEGFAEAVGQGDGNGRLDAALAHADTGAVPVRVQIDGDSMELGADDGEALSEWLREAFEGLEGDGVLKQDSVQVAEGRATVTTRVTAGEGEQTVIYTLVKPDARWLISRVRVL